MCKHPFIWPNGDCVDCGVLATLFPGRVEEHHRMIPRPVKMRYKRAPWRLVVEYLEAHPEGVTGVKLNEITGVYNAQWNPTLRHMLKELGYQLVAEPVPGPRRAGNPKIYKIKEI